MTKVYTTKSNANRAAKAAMNKTIADGYTCTGFDIVGENGSYTYVLQDDSGTTAANLEELGLYGLGDSEETAVCPHCGTNHIGNGYQDFVGVREVGGTMELTYTCLGCGGEWGPPAPSFVSLFEGYKAAGNSKCKSLRLTAAQWAAGDRKGFIAQATACGIKPATASANWACMKRGEF